MSWQPFSPQLVEQLPVQVTSRAAAFVQVTLELFPTVTAQVLPSPQVTLQEAPHVPEHFWPGAHCSEQLSLFSLHPAVWLHPI